MAGRPDDSIKSKNLNQIREEGNMRRLKKVTAVVLLAAVMGMSGSLAWAGPSESPGNAITATSEKSGAVEAPGFLDTVLILATLIM